MYSERFQQLETLLSNSTLREVHDNEKDTKDKDSRDTKDTKDNRSKDIRDVINLKLWLHS